jgi:demethoxyubiquinone hydroxylase (CLK1/Coq7/Cat5 family)
MNIFSKLESQLSVYRQRYSQTDKEKQTIQQLLQEEINHRNNVDSKLRQAEVRN